MSKITATAATSHVLSVTAMEEASRTGERTAGIDHMFLALVVNEQLAGQVLRSLGITLDAAREAVAAQHAEQLASLGIRAEAPAPGRITFHETGDYQWSERALDIIKRSAERERRGDAAAVLRALVAEPSGFIETVLGRLGTSPEEVRARLDEAERFPGAPQHTFEEATLSGASESFAPAPIEEVWELLADPARMPEWEPSIGGVEDLPPRPVAGASWTTRALLERPDGKPLRVKPEYRRGAAELVALEEPHCIEWRFTWPDAPKSNARRVRIELEPAAGGTQLRTSLAWDRDPERAKPRLRLGRLLRPLLRPVYRFVLWMQLMQLGGGISRAFR